MSKEKAIEMLKDSLDTCEIDRKHLRRAYNINKVRNRLMAILKELEKDDRTNND